MNFGKYNTVSVVYMNIRSINANLHKIEKFLCLVKNLPDIVCVYETWLISLKHFMGKLHGYYFVNKFAIINIFTQKLLQAKIWH